MRRRVRLDRPPLVQNYYHPRNVAARRAYTRGWFRLAGRVAAGAGGLAVAGLANLLTKVPRLDTSPVNMGRLRGAGAIFKQRRLARRMGGGNSATLSRPGRSIPMDVSESVNSYYGYRGIGGGATWQGKFTGRSSLPRVSGLTRGYAEVVKVSGVQKQERCTYLGITSYPYLDSSIAGSAGQSGSGPTTVCGRLFKDVVISLVRHYFRHFHAGRFEFESPDQPISSMNATINGLTGISEAIVIQYQDGTGGNTLNNSFVYLSNGVAGTYDTIRDLGNQIAIDMWTKWQSGYQPRTMTGERYQYPSGISIMNHGRMRLDQMVVSARCTTVLKVQNQSVAAENNTNALDVESNPLVGKIFYFKKIGPGFATGAVFGAGTIGDTWGEQNLSKPLFCAASTSTNNWNTYPYLENVYSSTAGLWTQTYAPPSSAWAVVPKSAYFKHCVREKAVSMEPGVMKQFALRFRFRGKLTDWLRRDASNFSSVTPVTSAGGVSADYSRGMGQCAILAVEKRIRDYTGTTTAVPIALSFEVDTYIHTTVSHVPTRMAFHVEANAS